MGRFKNTNAIPLAIAVQALAFFVVAFFVDPHPATSPEKIGAGSSAADTSEPLTSLAELPTDLRRQRLPVPRVPKREDETSTARPVPSSEGNDSVQSEGPKLASLKTQKVALSGVIAIPISAPMLGVPDSLDGLSLAGGGSWHGGGATQSARDRSRPGGSVPTPIGGGPGIGRVGGGGGRGGGYCPTPGRVGRRR